MVGHQREGWMLWQVMGALFVLAFTAFVYTESTGNPLLQAIGAEGLSWEGKDARFDLVQRSRNNAIKSNFAV